MEQNELISRYDAVLQDYQRKVVQRMTPQQYRDYAEVLFSTHSCAIEGNSFKVDDTRALKEQGLAMVVPPGKKLFECLEMADHLHAFCYVMDHLQHPLDEALLKEVNRLITEHTLSYTAPDAVAGEYTTVDMVAGDTLFGNHEKLIAQVPRLLGATEMAIQRAEQHPMIIAARFHGYYEYLHPFRDGNGRTGRLMSNYILARMGHPLLTIYLEERQQYIAALKQIRTEGTDEHLTAFFLETAINHMTAELAQTRQNTHHKTFIF